MPTYAIFQVDAFAERPLSGNPAAVIPLEDWLDDDLLQRIANENNLSETAYFKPSATGGYDLRWFTPAIEVRLCGHATLATAHVLFEHLGAATDTLKFHTKSGVLTVHKIASDRYEMDLPTDRIEPIKTPAAIREALSTSVVACFRGQDDLMAVLESENQIHDLRPDFSILRDVRARGLICTAPGQRTDFVSRCFYPAAGIDEDPVTGSAHTTMTPYWAERIGRTELTAEQLSQRGGKLTCQLQGTRTALISSAATYLRGEIYV